MTANGIEVAFSIHGDGDPVMLITGLGGVGRSWGQVIELFANQYMTIVPDHRGTGGSTRADHGYSIEMHARDMVDLLEGLQCGPTHVVGSSTGGAIAQVMALDHPAAVRTITLASSWAGPDDFFRHQFAVRKSILARQGAEEYAAASALFLFSPRFMRERHDQVEMWQQAASGPSVDIAILQRRIDMILEHDQTDRLERIEHPTLVLVGREDMCTPLHMSQELVSLIKGAELKILEGGHLIYQEAPHPFHETVSMFIVQH